MGQRCSMFLLFLLIGSFLGGICRFLISDRLNAMRWDGFPLGTFCVNATGSVLLGIVLTQAFIDAEAFAIEVFFEIGFLGAFTTFSSFSLEAYHLLQRGRFGFALTYLLASPIFSLGGFIGVVLLNGGSL